MIPGTVVVSWASPLTTIPLLNELACSRLSLLACRHPPRVLWQSHHENVNVGLICFLCYYLHPITKLTIFTVKSYLRTIQLQPKQLQWIPECTPQVSWTDWNSYFPSFPECRRLRVLRWARLQDSLVVMLHFQKQCVSNDGVIEEYKDPCIDLRQLSRAISTRGLPGGLAGSSYPKLIAVKSLPLLDRYHYFYFPLGVDSGRTSQ